MIQKSRLIMLIDDDESIGLYHDSLVKKSKINARTLFFSSPKKALEYLIDTLDPDYQKPDIILLDLNMPELSGWEFIDKFKKLEGLDYSDIDLYILSYLTNPMDHDRIENEPLIKGIFNKPMSIEDLEKGFN